MALPKWAEIEAQPDFQAADSTTRENVRLIYRNKLAELSFLNGADEASVRSHLENFDRVTKPTTLQRISAWTGKKTAASMAALGLNAASNKAKDQEVEALAARFPAPERFSVGGSDLAKITARGVASGSGSVASGIANATLLGAGNGAASAMLSDQEIDALSPGMSSAEMNAERERARQQMNATGAQLGNAALDAVLPISDNAKQALATPTIDGNILAGERPSINPRASWSQFAAKGLQTIGQMAPIIAGGIVSGGAVAGGLGAAQAFDEGSSEEGKRIADMPLAEIAKIPAFQRYMQQTNGDVTTARALTAADAARAAGVTQGVLGTADGLLFKGAGSAVRRSAIKEAAQQGAIQGAQETLEGVGSKAAASAAIGEELDPARIGEGSYENFALGMIPGAGIGGATTAISNRSKPKAEKPKEPTVIDQVAQAESATSEQNDKPQPTEAQKAAGNYAKAKVKIAGLDISIENPEGSTRTGFDPDGNPWENKLKSHYGYIKRSESADGEQVDVFIKPGTEPDNIRNVYVIDQVDPKTGEFDETKSMIGFESADEAKAAYLENYDADWKGFGAVTEMPMDQFKQWVRSENAKKPVALGKKAEVTDASNAAELPVRDARAEGARPPEPANAGIDPGRNAGIPALAGQSDVPTAGPTASNNAEGVPTANATTDASNPLTEGQDALRTANARTQADPQSGNAADTSGDTSAGNRAAQSADVRAQTGGFGGLAPVPTTDLQRPDGAGTTIPRMADGAIAQANEQPSAGMVSRATGTGVPQRAPAKARKNSTLRQAIVASGGLTTELARDYTGEPIARANRMYPGMFSKSGRNLGDIVQSGALDSFLPPNLRSDQFNRDDAPSNPDEAVAYIEDVIRRGDAAKLRSWETQEEIARDRYNEKQLDDAASEVADTYTEQEIQDDINALAEANAELGQIAEAENDTIAALEGIEPENASRDPGQSARDEEAARRENEEIDRLAAKDREQSTSKQEPLENRQSELATAWRKWGDDQGFDPDGDFARLVEKNRHFDEWGEQDVTLGEEIVNSHLALRKARFSGMPEAPKYKPTPDARTVDEVAFDRSPERALFALSDAELDAVGKAVGVKRKKGSSKEGFIERIGSTQEVRQAYQAVIGSRIQRPTLDLTGQSNNEILADEARAKKAADEKRAQENAPPPEDFMLTGSNRAADVGAAAGQGGLFDAAPEPKAKQEPAPTDAPREPSLKEARQYAKDNGLDDYLEHFDGMGRAAALNLSKADRAVIADMYAGKPYSTSTKAGGGSATPAAIKELRRRLSALESLRACLG